MTYRLKDGRVSAYYGDTNVTLELAGISTGTEVQFRKNAEDTWNVTIENGEVAIPNEFFNGTYSKIIFYVTDGANTIGKGSIDVIPRTFPSDYSYEPTKIRTYEDILAEMKGYDDSAKDTLNTINLEAEDVEDAGKDALTAISTAKTDAVKAVADTEESVLTSITTSQTNALTAIEEKRTTIKAEMESLRDSASTSEKNASSSASSASTSASSAEASALKAGTTLTAVESIKSNVASMASSVSASEEKVKQSESSVLQSEKNVKASEESVKASEENVTAMESAVSDMKESVSSMASQVSADKATVASDKAEVANTKASALSEISSSKTTALSEMNAVKEAVASLESSASASASNASASEENVKSMESNVATMESSVSSMASQVSADKEQVSTWVDSISGTATALSGFAEMEVSFPKSDDKILILRGSEGKYITTENLSSYIKTHDINPTYAELKALVNSGNFFDTYECGQAINVDFTYGGTTYAFPFQVAHNTYRETTRPDGTVRNSVPLLATYLPPMAVQFSQYRAFLACPSGLAAGSYSVTFAQAWSKLTTLTWYFTLTHAVPAGGRLNAFRNFADGQSDTSVRTYGADGKLMYTDSTVTSTAIDGATDLGTMNYTTRNGKFSSMQECFYGCNEYHTSAKKQFMDSDKLVNLWWAPQDEWDCAPDALSSYGGLLSYFDPDFVDILETVKVTTAKSMALGAASADYDTDYLRCFLPSLEEMYIVPQASTGMEGAYLQLAKDYVGKDSPNGWYSSNANTGLIRYDITNKSANWFHLRSARRDYSCVVWNVGTDGSVSNGGNARNAGRVLPLVYI